MTAGSLRTDDGSPSAMTLPSSRQSTRSLHAHDQRHVVLDDEHRRTELPPDLDPQQHHGLRLTLGDTGGGLVEAPHQGVEGQQAGQLDDAAGAGGGSRRWTCRRSDRRSPGSRSSSAASTRFARSRFAARGENTAVSRSPSYKTLASRASWTVSRTVSWGRGWRTGRCARGPCEPDGGAVARDVMTEQLDGTGETSHSRRRRS